MKLNIFISSLLLVTACTSVQQSTRVSTNLQAMQFNSVASQFMQRPTSITAEKMSDGESVLAITMENYGVEQSAIRFSKKHVPEYRTLINKYLKWTDIAKNNSDQLTKDIGNATTWGNASSGELKFTFHSGNQYKHFLRISFCAVGTCLDDQALFFDESEAKELSQLLSDFESGKITSNDVTSKYN